MANGGQTVRLVGDTQRRFAQTLVQRAPVGSVVNIREASRSNDQNAKFWAMLSDVSRAKPEGRTHTTEQWKAIFMAACDHSPAFLPDLEGTGFICTGYRSSRLSKAEMSDLIEAIYEYGARMGVVWSEPAERRAA